MGRGSRIKRCAKCLESKSSKPFRTPYQPASNNAKRLQTLITQPIIDIFVKRRRNIAVLGPVDPVGRDVPLDSTVSRIRYAETTLSSKWLLRKTLQLWKKRSRQRHLLRIRAPLLYDRRRYSKWYSNGSQRPPDTRAMQDLQLSEPTVNHERVRVGESNDKKVEPEWERRASKRRISCVLH
jgi:hypothetical protein